jgi:hypothetical protein
MGCRKYYVKGVPAYFAVVRATWTSVLLHPDTVHGRESGYAPCRRRTDRTVQTMIFRSSQKDMFRM